MITCEIHKYIFNKCNEKQLASSHEWQIIDLASIMKKISCNKDRHLIDETNHSIEDLDVQIIVQLEAFHVIKIMPENTGNSLRYKITLCTQAPCGLNLINELETNLKWSGKKIFYPIRDQQINTTILINILLNFYCFS